MSAFPRAAIEITPSWLTERLAANGLLTGGRVVAVAPTGQPKADRTASTIAIQYSPDAAGNLPYRAFFKYNANGRDRVEVRRHCAAVREALFYTEISPRCGGIAPRCFDAGGDLNDGEAYLILEDISASHVLLEKADVPSPYGGWASFENVAIEQFAAIVRAMARFQACWWDDPRIAEEDLASGTGDMLSMVMTASASFVEGTLTDAWEARVIGRLERYGEADPKSAMCLMRDAISAWPNLFRARIGRRDTTLMHGDLHLRNVLFPACGELEPLIIDWEGLTTGVGIADVAHLLATSMLSRDRAADLEDSLLSQYHGELIQNGVECYTLEDTWSDYRLALVALVPQAWDGSPFTRSVLSLFRRNHCETLIS